MAAAAADPMGAEALQPSLLLRENARLCAAAAVAGDEALLFQVQSHCNFSQLRIFRMC